MTTSLVRPVPALNSRRPRTAAQQLADTARRVADTYPELLAPDEFDPMRSRRDGDHEGAVRLLPVPSQRRVLFRLPAVLDHSVSTVAHSAAALVTLPGRIVGLVTSAEQTLAAIQAAVTRTDALLDRVESVTRTAEDVVQAASREVTTAAGAVEQARDLTARLAPLLGHLEQVSPDVNQLLDSVSQLNHMASRLPKAFRRVIAS